MFRTGREYVYSLDKQYLIKCDYAVIITVFGCSALSKVQYCEYCTEIGGVQNDGWKGSTSLTWNFLFFCYHMIEASQARDGLDSQS